MFKSLNGNNYAVLYLIPYLIARMMLKNAVISPDVVINMWEITTVYYYRREKKAVGVNPKLYTIVPFDPRSWLYGSHSSHYPNVSWQLGPSTNSGKRSEEYRSYLSERRARGEKRKKDTQRRARGEVKKRRREEESRVKVGVFFFLLWKIEKQIGTARRR